MCPFGRGDRRVRLSDRGVGGQFPSASSALEWMLLHMLEKLARHAGHLDLIPEPLDGERAYC